MDKIWESIGMFVVVVATILGAASIVAPHRVDGYYLSHSQSTATTASTCVYAHWTWHPDELSFCTDDYQKALDFVAKANQTVKP